MCCHSTASERGKNDYLLLQELQEYEEIHAHHFLDEFWYDDSLAHQAHPDWDFDLGTFSIPSEVSIPLSCARARKNRGCLRVGTEMYVTWEIVLLGWVIMPLLESCVLALLFIY